MVINTITKNTEVLVCNRIGLGAIHLYCRMEDEQLSMNDLFTKLVDEIHITAHKSKEEINIIIQNENTKIVQLIQEQNTKLIDLQKKQNILEQQNIHIERKLRQNNIILFGLSTRKELKITEFQIEVLKEINSLLDTNFKLPDCNSIYPLKSEHKNPIKVEFISHIKKQEIFQNIQKLKGTQVSISDDLCNADREKRKTLMNYLRDAKVQKLNAKILKDKLMIDGKIYTIEELKHIKETQANIPSHLNENTTGSCFTKLDSKLVHDTKAKSTINSEEKQTTDKLKTKTLNLRSGNILKKK